MDLDNLNDEELVASAFILRKRAINGDTHAARVAHVMEAEVRRRLGPKVSSPMPLETAIQNPRRLRSWWPLW
jgi:hypothetical protein